MYISSLRQLLQRFGSVLHEGDAAKIRERLRRAHAEGRLQRDAFGLDPVVRSLDTALLAADEIGLRRDGLVAVMLRPAAVEGDESVAADFGESVARIMHGLERIRLGDLDVSRLRHRSSRDLAFFAEILYGAYLQAARARA